MSALEYISDGSGLPEVPARNLSAAEVQEYGQKHCDLVLQQAEAAGDKETIAAARKLKPEKLLLDSGLYKKVSGVNVKEGE